MELTLDKITIEFLVHHVVLRTSLVGLLVEVGSVHLYTEPTENRLKPSMVASAQCLFNFTVPLICSR